jgi:NAD(P)H dehydrogenase (quinone)
MNPIDASESQKAAADRKTKIVDAANAATLTAKDALASARAHTVAIRSKLDRHDASGLARKPQNMLVVFCHPVRDSFVGACLDRTVAALEVSGHTVRVIDLYADDFQPALSLHERVTYKDPIETKSEILGYVNDLRWATGLVLVYPTWFGAQPAMLKGWFDRVWVDGVAYHLPTKPGLLIPALRNLRSLTVVTTHGSGKFMNALQGEPGKRVALRGLRSLCARLCRTRWIAFYGNDRADNTARTSFLARVSTEIAKL